MIALGVSATQRWTLWSLNCLKDRQRADKQKSLSVSATKYFNIKAIVLKDLSNTSLSSKKLFSLLFVIKKLFCFFPKNKSNLCRYRDVNSHHMRAVTVRHNQRPLPTVITSDKLSQTFTEIPFPTDSQFNRNI